VYEGKKFEGWCEDLTQAAKLSSGRAPMASNPSIERSSYSRLDLHPFAAHVER
jgi:hypothetical protein